MHGFVHLRGVEMTKYDEDEEVYNVTCIECECEFTVKVEYADKEREPSHCTFCGSELEKEDD